MALIQNWFAVVCKNLKYRFKVTCVQFQNSMDDGFIFSTENRHFAIINSRKEEEYRYCNKNFLAVDWLNVFI